MLETYLLRIEDTQECVDADMFQWGFVLPHAMVFTYCICLYDACDCRLYRRVEAQPGHCVQITLGV